MKKWNLKIILKSDLCTATGEDAPGIINVKTALENGIPYIPAKRIKGCLLEAGMEMRDNGLIEGDTLERIFGKPGAERTEGVYIGDSHLHSIPQYMFGEGKGVPVQIGDYELFQSEIRNCLESEKTYFEEFFTRKRTRTAIDTQTGTAKKNTLRTMQVVPAGVEFVSCIEGELNDKDEAVLIKCAKGLRHMGLGITRGLGEVQCILEEVTTETLLSVDSNIKKQGDFTKEKSDIFKEYDPEEDVVMSYEIYFDSPVMIDGNNDCLPAGPVLGALAGMYIRKFSLGADAHKDENFSRIFLHDGVQFGYGYLKRNDKIYVPCPKAIAEMRENDGNWFNIEQDRELKRKELKGLVCWEGEELHIASANREIHFHHARPIDRGIAHALNDRAADSSIPTGEFFEYTPLSKGQTYAGTWRGKAKDIRVLAECLQDNDYRLRIGRSRTAEYGNCTFKIVRVDLKRNQIEPSPGGNEWMMWLLSPLIIRYEKSGDYTLKEVGLIKQLGEILGCKKIELRKIAGSCTVYSGYNSRWGMPMVSCPAADVGSTFYLKTDHEIHACKLEENRWGELTGRGCGQVAVRPWNKEDTGKIIIDSDAVYNIEKSHNSIAERIICLRKHQLECKYETIEELDIVKADELPPSSAISLLSQLLRSYAQNKDFYEQIKEKVMCIHKEDKRDKILKLIEPCEGKTYEFMKLYLENAKWKARCRVKDE